MTLSEPEVGKRRDIVPVPGGDFDLPSDMVIEALGFEPETFAADDDATSAWTEWNTVATALLGLRHLPARRLCRRLTPCAAPPRRPGLVRDGQHAAAAASTVTCVLDTEEAAA